MVQVMLSGSLQAAACGSLALEVEATTIRLLLVTLKKKVPGFEEHFEQGVAVSINGQIFRDDWSREIPADAEVFVLPRLSGG